MQASLSSIPSWTQKPLSRNLASSAVDGEPAVVNKAANVASKQEGDEGSNQSGPAGKAVRGGVAAALFFVYLYFPLTLNFASTPLLMCSHLLLNAPWYVLHWVHGMVIPIVHALVLSSCEINERNI